MELVYVTRAVRRYWWTVALLILVGTTLGVVSSPPGGGLYETESWVQVQGGGGGTSTDRDVSNQLVLLGSDNLAADVSERVGDISPTAVRLSTAFLQVPSSDVIRIVVQRSSPETAQQVANAYVDAYLDSLRTQIDAVQEPDLESIETRLAELEAQLAAVDEQIDEALEPFRAAAAAGGSAAIPTIDQVSPTLATQRQLGLDQYLEALRARNEMRLAGLGSELPTQMAQRADLPTQPISSGISLRVIAGPVVGLLLGVLAATALARMSPNILDEDEVSSILGIPVAASFPRESGLGSLGDIVANGLPDSSNPLIHDLSVRIEASSNESPPLTIAVAGSSQVAGVSTIATALARHLAADQPSVLLVDLDTTHPELTEHFDEGVSGVHRLIRMATAGSTRTPRVALPGFVTTAIPQLRFAGLGEGPAEQLGIRRNDIAQLMEGVGQTAKAVVFDVGNLMDAAASVQLAQVVDAVVLAVPIKHQRRSGLEVVARQLASGQVTVLPVVTPTSRRRSRPDAAAHRRAAASAQRPEDGVDEERAEATVAAHEG